MKLYEISSYAVFSLMVFTLAFGLFGAFKDLEPKIDISSTVSEIVEKTRDKVEKEILNIGWRSAFKADRIQFSKLADSVKEDNSQPEPISEEQKIINYIYDICQGYPNVDPELIQAIVYYESRYNPKAVNASGTCVGLMQISTRWHRDRAIRLTGSDDLFDPYVNLRTGIDYLNDLISKYGTDNIDLAIMVYNGSGDSAFERHKSGNLTSYARNVLTMREELKNA